MASVVRANNRMARAYGTGRIPFAGGGGGGGGGGGLPAYSPMGAFGDENERESGGFIGPFGWGGGLTEGAKAARAAHAENNEQVGKVMQSLQDEMVSSGDPRRAFIEVLKKNPGAMMTLHNAGMDNAMGLNKLFEQAKPVNVSAGGKLVNPNTGETIASNPIEPGRIQDLGVDENGNHIWGRFGGKGQTPGMTESKPPPPHTQLEWVTNPDGSRTLTAVNKDTGTSATIGAPGGGGGTLTSAPKQGNFLAGEQNELNSLEQLGPAIKALQRYAGVTGVIEGIPAWVAGKKLGFGQEAQPFFSNLDTAAGFINGLSIRSTRVGSEVSKLQNLLPNPNNASSYNIGENVPQLALAYRRAISSLASEAARKNTNDQTLNGLVKEYNASPDQMQALDHAINQTRENGGAGLTDQDIHTLVKNTSDLPVSVKTVTIGQGASRGMIPVDTWNNWASKHPDMSGVTHPGNLTGAPDQVAPPANQAPPPARSPAIPHAVPPGPQAPTTQPPIPSGSVRPPPQTLQLPPSQAPGTAGSPLAGPSAAPPLSPVQQQQDLANRQSQLPQQIQQVGGQMAPPGGAPPGVIPPGGAYAPIPPRQPGQP